MADGNRLADEAVAVITGVVEQVFGSVLGVRDEVVAAYRAAVRRSGRMHERDLPALRGPVLEHLTGEHQTAVGMGVVLAPGVLADRELHLEWWQYDGGADRGTPASPTALDVDLNPASVGFYDYAAADWFVGPRRTGRRHVVGPYVDVHGTDRYLLTLTAPVVADGEFVGITGADLPVARFEALVLRALGTLPADVVVVTPEDRVALSTSARWFTGCRSPFTGADATRVLDDPPWRVVVLPHRS
ncbi:cache domain-containing protein [Pseudonocardia sp. HH130630-07]|uniref:cache domain-containing protein n=1 Tax=Pseudonocardia sp. HH130630-07 TaxID=1690815 RepID=UPI000839C0B0|nr:cache domain-containing protein [Pseudonocardia sp. HH130630-07]